MTKQHVQLTPQDREAKRILLNWQFTLPKARDN